MTACLSLMLLLLLSPGLHTNVAKINRYILASVGMLNLSYLVIWMPDGGCTCYIDLYLLITHAHLNSGYNNTAYIFYPSPLPHVQILDVT